jgi:hypothetical protein
MKTKQFLFNLLSIGLLVILLGLVTVNPLPTYAQGSVSIEVNPPSKTVQVDEIFDVTIQVVAGAQQVDGAEVHLTFDPAFLEVQSLAAGTNLPMTLVPPTFDNGAGTIDYGAGALPPSLPSGTFDLLTITFKALAQTTGTGLTFITTGFPKTDATFQGNSILASVGPGSVVIEPSVIASLVINEIDYDQPGTDDAEFIEIKNVSDQSINLDLYAIELVNGNGGGAAVYQTIDLPNVDLATDGYYVVCGDAANVTNCDLDVSTNTNLIQNDTDAVAIVLSDTVIDTVSYEGDTGAPYTETAGVTPGDNNDDDAIGLSRFPDGIDTDHNDNDFSLRCITPGETNSSADSNCAGPQFGSLTIIKDANPADDTTFNFTSDIPGSSSFSLQDPSGNSITIIEMTPNTYTITETLPINWQLDSAACTGGSDSGSLNGETLSVAVGADEAVTCTFTNTYVQPETGSITLYKTVINDNGGIAGPNDFGLQIGDTPVISGQAVEIPAGQTVAISETGKSGYQFVSITGAQCPAELGGTVTVAAGDDIECTLTNDDIAPQLTVIKEVINDDGGDAEPDDFTMQVSGTNVSSPSFPGDAGGTTVTLDAGSYTVSESGPTGYDATFDGCAGTIGVGESKTCTITNDDIAPTCYALTLSHSGQGSNPVAAPSNSTGCGAGQYVAGEVISLSGAVPDSGWEISGWSGTADDSSTASSNSLTMPAGAHSASVIYTEILPAQSSIDLEKFTNGHDADTAPGPNIPIGDPVEWTYEIENTGSLPLTAISLVDDPQGTITCDEGVIPDLDPGDGQGSGQ